MFAQETLAYIGTVSVPVIMSYSETDPFAVAFTFATDNATEWVFSRELLFDGLVSGASGTGDVRFEKTGTSLMMTLSSNETANILFVASEVQQFLDHTAVMVPYGQESEQFDIQAEWAEWRDDEAV